MTCMKISMGESLFFRDRMFDDDSTKVLVGSLLAKLVSQQKHDYMNKYAKVRLRLQNQVRH